MTALAGILPEVTEVISRRGGASSGMVHAASLPARGTLCSHLEPSASYNS